MTLRLLPLLMAVLLAGSVTAQNTVGTIAFDPDLYTEGYTMIYPHNQNRAMLLNACGEVVHDWTVAEDRRPGNTAYLQENGDIIMTSRPASVGDDPIWAGGGGARIERRTWDNDVLWSFTANNDSLRLHHDFTVTPSGNVIAICWEVLDSLECIENGRDPALLTGGELWSDKLIELQPDGMGGADIVWEWRAWDHLVQDFDSTKANFGVVADNQSLIDLNYGSLSNQPADWLHMNAVDYWPYTDVNQIVMSVPTFNEVWVIWHGGFFDGDIIYRWGNPAAYDRGDSTHQRLFYQHDIHWGNGLGVNPGNPDFTKFFLFNNRVPNVDTTGTHSEVATLSPLFDEYPEPGGSVYEFDFDNGRWGPDDFEWTYTQPGLNSSGLSSYQRLGNGGSLICSGRTGELFELTESGDLAWQYRTPLLAGAPVEQGTELQLNNNLTFRADRYPADFPAFDGQDLSSGEVIEVNPTPLEVCAAALCEDLLACNYGDEGECDYIDANAPDGTLGPLFLGLVDEACADGYAVYDDLIIGITPATGDFDGYAWDISPEVEAILVAAGQTDALNELNAQVLSVCGDIMTVYNTEIGVGGPSTFDGSGWVWPQFDGYMAPVSGFDAGCGDPDACNFDACTISSDSLCSAMVGTTATDNETGFLSCEVTGGIAPYQFELLDGDLQPTGIEGGTGNLSIAWGGLPDGAYCVEVTDAAGCVEVFCDTLGVSHVGEQPLTHFTVQPNPAQDAVRWVLPAEWSVRSITLRDATGREVMAPLSTSTSAPVYVGHLANGTYLVEVRHAEGVAIERLVVRH